MKNNIIKIQLKLETTDYSILKSKQYILHNFCNIYNIKYISYNLPTKKKKIALLKSPHIHKKTWRTYIMKTFIYKYTLYITNKKYLYRLYTLSKHLSTHCTIHFKFTEN